MSAVPRIIEEPLDVAGRLAALAGLTTVDLTEAVKGGHVARATCTENDAPSFPGIVQWGVTTRTLREQLMTKGWEKDDSRNFSTTRSPDGTVAIVVATGDEGTGIASKTPKTNYPKGTVTHEAVDVNRTQLDLPGITPISDATRPRATTYVLLIANQSGRGVRAELSLPLEIGEDGRIEMWAERIILPPLEDDGGESARRGAERGPDFDVDVVRRTG